MTIAQDAHATSQSSPFDFTHGAGVLVIVLADTESNAIPSGVTCGGAAMTKLTQIINYSAGVGGVGFVLQLWYLFRSAAATDSIAITGGTNKNFLAVSYTGTATAEPFFEGTVTGNRGEGSAKSYSLAVAAGTTGRLVFGAVVAAINTAHTLTVISGFTEIDQISKSWIQGYINKLDDQYKDTSSAASPGGTDSVYVYWGIIGTAILAGIPSKSRMALILHAGI